jgi:hypothetical protein
VLYHSYHTISQLSTSVCHKTSRKQPVGMLSTRLDSTSQGESARNFLFLPTISCLFVKNNVSIAIANHRGPCYSFFSGARIGQAVSTGELELADLSASHRVSNHPRILGLGSFGVAWLLAICVFGFRSSILIFLICFFLAPPLSTTARLDYLCDKTSRQNMPVNLRSGSSTQPADFNPKPAG